MSGSWKFEWFTTWQVVWHPDVIERWQSILQFAIEPHVFATPALVRAWWLASQQVYTTVPRFLIATRGGATIFMPLVIIRYGLKNGYLRTLQAVGQSEYDYHDPVACGILADHWPAFWESFGAEIQKRWGGEFDVAILSGLRVSPNLKGTTVYDRAPYFSIKEYSSPTNFLSSLSGSLRGDIGRQIRRLGRLGTVSYRVLKPDEADTALLWLPNILSQHSAKWPNSYKLPEFHKFVVQEALPAGLLHVSELAVGDTPVSRHIGFYYCHRLYWYMPVFDPTYQTYSPGKVHLYFCASDAIARGGEIFDLLRGEEEYKSLWTDRSCELFQIKWRGSSIASALRQTMAESLKPFIHKLLEAGRR